MQNKRGTVLSPDSPLQPLVTFETARRNKLRCRLDYSNFWEIAHMFEEISATELKQRIDAGDDLQIVDVRQPDEFAFAKIPGAKLVPLGEVVRRMNELDPDRETVILCKMGGRSARAIDFLKQAGFTGELKNLKGGITAWSNDVDPKVPKY
jgi:adenylyltransferase/sulfurtransferase